MFSKLVRRTHMYLALFLSPWMLMYALSTLVMNHRAVFVEKYGRGPIPWEKQQELTYDGTFAENIPLAEVSRQILISLHMDGAHGVTRQKDGTIVINRADLVVPQRITYNPAAHTLVIEKLQYRTNALLERFHRRRGYTTGYGLNTAWAVSVDFAIAGMIFWALSGVWMWWEMKATRVLGALAMAGGLGLFAFYVFTI
jgi:hypothetical protein